MKQLLCLLACCVALSAFAQVTPSAAPVASPPATGKEPILVSYVDPYIGTGAHGHTFIGASVPFGAVQVGPSNINKGWDWCSGYNYSDSVVKGFAQNHLNGTGIPDLSDILIMPFTGPVRTEPGARRSLQRVRLPLRSPP
jgi:putative alpha-1,2-mannosidase